MHIKGNIYGLFRAYVVRAPRRICFYSYYIIRAPTKAPCCTIRVRTEGLSAGRKGGIAESVPYAYPIACFDGPI